MTTQAAAFVACCALLSFLSTASAETGIAVEEIVVTAQKRAQNIHDVPLSLSAESGAELREQGVSSVIDLSAAIPFVNVSRNIGVPNVYIRGIGSSFLGVGGDGSIAFHLDGAYISRPRAQVAGFYDLERIEVLRGPQGTLYGRNATGGNINVVTRKPTDTLDAYGLVSVGDYDRLNVEGAVGGPIAADVLNGRLSFVSLNREGFGKNVRLDRDIDDQSEWGTRGQLEFLPFDRLSLLLSVDHYDADDSAFGWHATGPAAEGVPLTAVVLGASGVPDDIRDIDSVVPTRRNVEISGAALTVTYDLLESLQIKSISGYRDSRSYVHTDISAGVPPSAPTPEPVSDLTQGEDAALFTQELQLAWSGEDSDVLLGLYYLNEDLFGDVVIHTNVLPVLGATGLGILPVPFPDNSTFRQHGTVETEAWAVFANMEHRFTDRLTAILGMRYSDEMRERDGFFIAPTPFENTVVPSLGKKTWDDFSPKLTLDYWLTDNVHVYGTAGRGFKSGVLIAGSLNPPVEPETVTSYEIGLKSRLFSGHGRANLALFYNDYTDLQLNRVDGVTVTLENASDAEISGIELEVDFDVTDTLSIGFEGSYTNSEFKEYDIVDPTRVHLGPLDLAGNALPQAPEFVFHLDVAKSFVLQDSSRVSMRVDWSWRDDVYFDPFNRPNNFQEAYHLLGTQIGWRSASDRYGLTAWVRNLTDETVLTSGAISSDFLGFPQLVAVNEPRTWGVSFELRY